MVQRTIFLDWKSFKLFRSSSSSTLQINSFSFVIYTYFYSYILILFFFFFIFRFSSILRTLYSHKYIYTIIRTLQKIIINASNYMKNIFLCERIASNIFAKNILYMGHMQYAFPSILHINMSASSIGIGNLN